MGKTKDLYIEMMNQQDEQAMLEAEIANLKHIQDAQQQEEDEYDKHVDEFVQDWEQESWEASHY